MAQLALALALLPPSPTARVAAAWPAGGSPALAGGFAGLLPPTADGEDAPPGGATATALELASAQPSARPLAWPAAPAVPAPQQQAEASTGSGTPLSATQTTVAPAGPDLPTAATQPAPAQSPPPAAPGTPDPSTGIAMPQPAAPPKLPRAAAEPRASVPSVAEVPDPTTADEPAPAGLPSPITAEAPRDRPVPRLAVARLPAHATPRNGTPPPALPVRDPAKPDPPETDASVATEPISAPAAAFATPAFPLPPQPMAAPPPEALSAGVPTPEGPAMPQSGATHGRSAPAANPAAPTPAPAQVATDRPAAAKVAGSPGRHADLPDQTRLLDEPPADSAIQAAAPRPEPATDTAAAEAPAIAHAASPAADPTGAGGAPAPLAAPTAATSATPSAATSAVPPAVPPGPPPAPPLVAAPARPERRASNPVRQVAPVAVALALSPGRAPRLVLALEPAELGRVEIRIQRPTDRGAAAVQVLVERPETLALLRQDAQGLDRALQQAGLPAAERTLSFALAQDHGGDGQGRPDQPPHRQPGHGHTYPTAVPSPGDAHTPSNRSIIDLAI